MFLQQRGITYQTRRYHSTNIAPCSTHEHTHTHTQHCYQQLICIVSLFSLAIPVVTAPAARSPVPSQSTVPSLSHALLTPHLHNYCCVSKWPTTGGYRGCRAERHVPSGLAAAAAAGRDSGHRTSENKSRQGHVEMCSHTAVVRFLHHLAIW